MDNAMDTQCQRPLVACKQFAGYEIAMSSRKDSLEK